MTRGRAGELLDSGVNKPTTHRWQARLCSGAPKAGTVERVAIGAVQQVEGGDLLVVLK